MLRALRDGAKTGFLKYILLGLLVLAGGGLVFTDVGGFFRGGVSNNLVAKGKGFEISTRQFDRTVRRILTRQGMSPEEAYNLGFINQILNSEVQTRILMNEARKLGINVGDDVVMTQISKIAEPLAQNGTSKKEALRQVLNSQGISEGEFIQAIRQEIGNSLFNDALVSGAATISKKQAQDLYQYQNEMRSIRGFTLLNKDTKIEAQATDENLEKYYNANKFDFLISEKRDITLATLRKETIEDKVEISEDELKDSYEENINSYKKPEQRQLQQAILDLQTDAQEIVKKLNAGKSLKSAVKTVTGNSSPYLGENNFEENGLLEEISKPVFEGKKGDIIGPIQTALGWHVLVLKDILPPQTVSFDKAKKEIKEHLLQDKIFDELVDTANSIDDRLASGEKLEDVVADTGLTTETFKGFNQAGINKNGKDLFAAYQGDRAQILEASFDYDSGEVSPVMELADGRFVAVRIDDIQEKSYTPLKDVKNSIKERWTNEQKRLANKQRAEDAMTALSTGKSIEDVSKDLGVKMENFTKLKRVEAPKAPLTLESLRQTFSAEKGENLKLNIIDGYLIGAVDSIKLPDATKDMKQVEEIVTQTKEILPQETVAQYINALSQKYNVKINERVLKEVYGPKVEN